MTLTPDGGAFPWSFAALDGPDADFTSAAVAILPAPYDGTVSYRAGARDGPRAIIEASRYLELYEPDLDLEPSQWGITTLPALEPNVSGPEANIARVEQAVGALAEAGKVPVMLGGEHTLTIGAVRAFSRRYPGLSVLQLDAHADMRDTYQGSRYSHACVMRRVREVTGIGNVIQAGIRSISREEIEHIRDTGAAGVHLYTPGMYADHAAIEELLAGLGDTVYVTVDLDALGPCDHARCWHTGAGRTVVAGDAQHPAGRRRAITHRRFRRHGTGPERGSGARRIHRRAADVQADRLHSGRHSSFRLRAVTVLDTRRESTKPQEYSGGRKAALNGAAFRYRPLAL